MKKITHTDERSEASMSKASGRRMFLKKATAAAVLGTTAMSVSQAKAGDGKPLPLTTPITDPAMGLIDVEIKLLSPGVLQLTKGDLVDLHEHVHGGAGEGKSYGDLIKGNKHGLTFKDCYSINAAFIARCQRHNNSRAAAIVSGATAAKAASLTISCCCCSPCCCCTASVVIKPRVA